MNKYVRVTENETKDREFWLPCTQCHVETVHRVVMSIDSNGDMENMGYDYQWNEQHQIIQCQGCRIFSFRHESSNSDDNCQVGEDEWATDVKEELYPPRYKQRPQLPDSVYLPRTVRTIYEETHFTLCTRKFILAGIGIRALIESICKDRKATGKTLRDMIEHLVTTGDLKRREADVLHKLRSMGNEAAHEAKLYKEDVLDKAFEIVEHLLVTVYVLEEWAHELPKTK